MDLDHTELTPRSMAGFSVSMFALGLISLGFGAVDLAMIAPLGLTHVAAVGLGEAIFTMIAAFVGGFTDSFAGRLAQAEGGGLTAERFPQLVGALLLVLLPIDVLLVAIALAATLLLRDLHQNAVLVPLAGSYIAVRLIGSVLNVGFAVSTLALRICGLQNVAVRILVVGLALNAVFDYGFLYGPLDGLFSSAEAGVAAATVLAQFAMGVIAVVLLRRSFDRRGEQFARPRWDAILPEAKSMGRVGLGLGIRHFNDYADATIPFLMLGTLSVGTVAAAAATKIWTLYCRVPQACFSASFVFYGYELGRDPDSTHRLPGRLVRYSAIPTAVGAVVFLLASPALALLFGGSHIGIGLTVALTCAFFLALFPYFYVGLYGELLSVRQEGAFLSTRSALVTYGLSLPLSAVGVFVLHSAFLAFGFGVIPTSVLAVMFVNRAKRLEPEPEEDGGAV